MKKGTAATATVTLTLYQGSNTGGTVLATKTQAVGSFTKQFAVVDFDFSSVQSLGTGQYYVVLASNAADQGNEQFFIKGVTDAIISLDGNTPISPSIAGVSVSPSNPNFALSKSATSSVATSGTITYTVGLGNDGGSLSGTSATVKDQLPTGVTATAATASTGVSLVSCTNLGTSGALLTCTVTLNSGLATQAIPGTAAFTITATAPSSAGSITNFASVDATGGTNPATPNSSCTTTSCDGAATTVTAPNLTVVKTASAATLVRGGTGSFTLAVTNSGGVATDGTAVTVTDTLPTGLDPSAASGTGWTCSISDQDVSCTRSDALAGSASYDNITITVAVASNAGASLTNTASVSGGGDGSAATGSVTVATAASIDLTVVKTASASTLVRGGTGSFTLAVTNTGGTATDGTLVTLTDTLPAGLTPTGATGTGWTCSISGQDVSCTRSDALAGSASYPNIAVAVNVASDAGTPLTNTGSVSGGGDGSAATGSVTVATAASIDLTVVKTASAATLVRGGTGSFTLAVTNSGGVATDGTAVTVTDTLPTGLDPSAASGTGWTCSISGQNVSCTRSDALAGSASYDNITITVAVASNAGASLTNTASVSGGGDGSAATGAVTVATADPINLTVTKTASAATLVRGGTGSFTLAVTNSGGVATDGTAVTVTDTLPTGLDPSAASGTGWTCSISDQDVSCTRSDALAGSASYDNITITVAVASNAGASLTNTAV